MPILTYHHIGPCPADAHEHAGLWVAPAQFEAQLAWLRSHGYLGLSVKEVAELLLAGKSFPSRWVAITFDDGWRDNFDVALSLLRQYGFTATIFVTAGRLRSDATSPASGGEMMSADEVRELARAGLEIGCHTLTHPKLTRLNDEQARGEIVRARDLLAEIVGAPPQTFSYPYGAFSRRIEALVREAGFIAAVSTIRDNRVRRDDLFHLPRVMVMGTTTLARFRYMLSPLYHLLHAWKNRKRWQGLK